MQKRTFTIPENSKVLHSFKKRGKRIDFIEDSEDSWWIYIVNTKGVKTETYMITERDLPLWLAQMQKDKWTPEK